ncbi:hypothetical protein [Phenylobacterium soli]|uniref:Tetratricopeptide repeat protein n=1 Tax=Phenylobacterium soli TaxID=2170551 RepID=A0A328AN77_9CAUL|nr:hypothetical protein [Phenylobacterium soli]RAK56019.1 hypothetical protein DJ017_16635 [Phenylobacterium soli]
MAPQVALAAFLTQRGGEEGDILEMLEPAIKDADLFARMPASRRYQLAALYAAAAYRLGEWDAAHKASVLATEQAQAGPEDWDRRFHVAILAGDGADAYQSFQRLMGREPLLSLSGRQLERFDRLLGELPDARQARLALGREMEREAWEPAFVIYDPSRVWLDYARALDESGDRRKAAAIARRITDPTLVMAVQADPRFDDLVRATPTLGDARAAAERYLAQSHDYMRENPRMLNGRVAEARALVILGRSSEALKLLDEAVQALGAGPRRQPAFDDMDDEPVLQYWRSAAMIDEGRLGEAIGARTAAAACHCSGLDAVMLAQALLEAGRAKEAKRWLDQASDNGLGLEDRMLLAKTRACVAVEAGAGTDAAAMNFLVRHERWAPAAMIEALLCAGDFDGAAAALVRQLEDPESRIDALAGLQAYGPEPNPWSHRIRLRAAWARLAARPDVRAALAKVGRRNAYDLRSLPVIG